MLSHTPLSEANVAFKQWYLSTYLLLKSFETLVANMDMRLLALYTQRFPWKYNIRRPFEKPPQTIDKYDDHAAMVNLVTRCSVSNVNEICSILLIAMIRKSRLRLASLLTAYFSIVAGSSIQLIQQSMTATSIQKSIRSHTMVSSPCSPYLSMIPTS